MAAEEAMVTATTHQPPVKLRMHPAVNMTDEQFFELCRLNPLVRLERTANGEIEVMTPTGWESGAYSLAVGAQLYTWAQQDGTGVATDSSAGFVLPNGAIRAPDAAWVDRRRLAGVPREVRQRFLPLCPDFVVEIASPSDRPAELAAKLDEYIANGARLGWLLLPPPIREVLVYAPGGPAQSLVEPRRLTGDPVLPGFELDLAAVWGAANAEGE